MHTRRDIRAFGLAGLAAITAVGLGACDDDPTSPATPTTFQVTIQNVSGMGTIASDRVGGSVPLSPGAYAVFSGADPLFTDGQLADSGTRLIAEDGFPSFPDMLAPPQTEGTTELELLAAAGVTGVGVFQAPGAGTIGPAAPGIFPGETATFTITASRGDRLQIETMFVQSGDWFYAFEQDGDAGLALFDGDDPISGVVDVNDVMVVYDAGTEIDVAPGTGPMTPPGAVQKPVQDPTATSVGTDESVPIQDARTRHSFDIPDNSDVIRVTITPQ